MNIIIFYILLLLENIICKNDIDDINKIKNNIINNDFNNIFIKENITILYFGSQFFYIIINKTCSDVTSYCPIFTRDKDDTFINISFKDDNKNYIFNKNETKFSILNNMDDDEKSLNINISNSSYYLILKFNENASNTNQITNNIKEINYSYNIPDGIAVQLLRGEYFFIRYIFFSYILIIFGCFLLLYGAYHFSIGIIFHATLFLLFYFNDIFEISLNCKISDLIYLYIFFCLIIGISMGIFLNTDKKDNKKYLLLKIFHGCSFGFSFFKIIIHYFLIIFDIFDNNDEHDRDNEIYFAFSIIFIFLGILLNLYNPFKKYIFLPASAVAGSHYFVKGIKFVIGGYYSDNIFLRYKLPFDYLEYNFKIEIILTYLFMTIILIIFSIFFQINYIKQKQEEMPTEIINPENYEISRISDLSRTSNSVKPEDEKELINKSNQNKTADEDDDDINDQED